MLIKKKINKETSVKLIKYINSTFLNPYYTPNINESNSFKKITFALQLLNMKKSLFLWMILSAFNTLFSQEKIGVVERDIVINKKQDKENVPLDSIKNMYGGRYVDYKIITQAYDTIQIDTTLNIHKYFRHNYTQQDDFEWVGFANQGQTYNKLGYDLINNQITPNLGVTAKLYNYYEVEDMKYYHVPTPSTILYYRSGFDGQILNSTFTTNFGKHQNFSIGYKGLRSIGDYQNSRASHVNFRVAYTYYNPKKRYQFRLHIITQKLDNQENRGLTTNSITEFMDDNPDFSSRGRVDVNLYDSESFFKTSRYYYEHELRILNSKDSLHQNLTNLKLGHSISIENRKYEFKSTDTDYFDNTPSIYGTRTDDVTNDKTEFNTSKNQVYIKFNSPWVLGNFKVFGTVYNTSQIYDALKTVDTKTISKENNLDYTSFGATWNSKYKGIFLNAYGEQVLNGGNLGSNIHINAGFKLKDNTLVQGGLQLKTSAPNSNTTLFQSNFSNLNWDNVTSFENEISRILYGNIKTKWINADVYLHQLKNYTYFNTNSVASQYNQTIDYVKVKLSNEFKWKKIHLNNSILLQKVTQGSEAFRVPDLVTRNLLYYQDYFFKGKPLLAQIGVSFKYFTKYYANELNPVLNEFYIQNTTKIGGYPTLGAFVNGQVRRTRIYFKVENISASVTGKNYFASPSQPTNDLTLRLGLVWNFWN